MAVLLLSTLNGQFYFGRNKIQYEQFDWQVLNTPHFQIYYYPDEELLAQAAAAWAEETFDELEQKFDHTLARPVPLVIYSSHLHFQQTNTIPYLIPEGVGGFFEYLKGRVVLPNTGSMFNFRKVLRHELVHVFTSSKIGTNAQAADVWNYGHPPLWFTEGLAEWWSLGWDSEAEMVIRDALLHDHLLPLDSQSLEAAGFLLYKEGQSFLRYLEEKHGIDCLRQVLEECHMHNTFADALESVTGISYDQLTEDWRLRLKQETAESLARQSLPGQNTRQITWTGANVGPAVYQDSTGRTNLVYLSSRDGYTNIYHRVLDDPEEQLMLRGERSPELESLYILESGLSVSATSVLAFVTKSYERDAIQLLDLNSLESLGWFSHPEITSIRSPDWSPDGGRIVFAAQDLSGQTDIYLWTVPEEGAANDELNLRRLTDDIYFDREPCFSPDGSAIVFSSDRGRAVLDGGTNLFLLNLNDSSFRMITSGPQQDQRPRWSDDDPDAIQFISDRSGTPNIWKLNLSQDTTAAAASSNLALLTDLHTGILDMLPLPGDSLLITTFQKYNYQLHLAPATVGQIQPRDSSTSPITGVTSWLLPQYQGETTVESQPYNLKYSLDFAQTAVAQDPIFGFLGGAQLSVSDMLGNRYYHFLLANSSQPNAKLKDNISFSITAANLSRRTNYAWGFFRFANQYYDPYQAYYFEKTLGIRAAFEYPFNVFRRIELSSSLWQSKKYFSDFTTDEVSAMLLSSYLSFVHDNSIWLTTGPVDGWCFRATAGLTFDLERSRYHNYTAMLDNRIYWRFKPNLTFAQRAWYGIMTGLISVVSTSVAAGDCVDMAS